MCQRHGLKHSRSREGLLSLLLDLKSTGCSGEAISPGQILQSSGDATLSPPVSESVILLDGDNSPNEGFETLAYSALKQDLGAGSCPSSWQNTVDSPQVISEEVMPEQVLTAAAGPSNALSWWRQAAARWQSNTATLRAHIPPRAAQPGGVAEEESLPKSSDLVLDAEAEPIQCDSEQSCPRTTLLSEIDNLVILLAGCQPSTLRAISDATSASPCVKLLQECLLGGVQERRVELFHAMTQEERQIIFKITSLSYTARDVHLLNFLEDCREMSMKFGNAGG